jgi:hypothetical protein
VSKTERMSEEAFTNAVNLAQQWWTPDHVGVQLAQEAERARAAETAKDKTIQALAQYIRTHAGHEEHCRGWRMVGKGHNRRERMEIEHCTCGPGKLLRDAGLLP